MRQAYHIGLSNVGIIATHTLLHGTFSAIAFIAAQSGYFNVSEWAKLVLDTNASTWIHQQYLSGS
jgi:hypothetical protein